MQTQPNKKVEVKNHLSFCQMHYIFSDLKYHFRHKETVSSLICRCIRIHTETI